MKYSFLNVTALSKSATSVHSFGRTKVARLPKVVVVRRIRPIAPTVQPVGCRTDAGSPEEEGVGLHIYFERKRKIALGDINSDAATTGVPILRQSKLQKYYSSRKFAASEGTN